MFFFISRLIEMSRSVTITLFVFMVGVGMSTSTDTALNGTCQGGSCLSSDSPSLLQGRLKVNQVTFKDLDEQLSDQDDKLTMEEEENFANLSMGEEQMEQTKRNQGTPHTHRGDRCFLDDDECASDLFCKVGDYSCSEEKNPSGRCRPIEENATCPINIAPVCGCDGRTYDNKCLAYAAGVNVAKNDECDLPGNGGEKCFLNDRNFCTKGLFCRVGNYACGEEDNPQGRCVPEPEMCSYELHEVCGCDGRTYSNPCSAYAAGVNIEKNEPCHAKSNLGEQCFFDDEDFCGNGLFCKIQDYYCKYEPNPAGVCRKEPEDKSCSYEADPVCGCDCNTYGNRCKAYAAGVNIYANSPCPRLGCQLPK